MKIIFPKGGQKYWSIHYRYVQNIFAATGAEISFHNQPGFRVCMDGKWIQFDYSDDGESLNEVEIPTFKFHFKHHHFNMPNVYPFLPVCFYKWVDVKINLPYLANENVILNNQKPYGDAIERRNTIREILVDYNVDYSITAQSAYWYKIKHCLVSLHVPGRNNNMLDRGQLQLMALGCATISPYLPEVLPRYQLLNPGEHYIQCKNDYSDLTNIIEWCRNNREKCVEIGRNARALFLKYFMPDKLVEFIQLESR